MTTINKLIEDGLFWHLSKPRLSKTLALFFQYINGQIAFRSDNDRRYSGFVLDLANPKSSGKIGLSSTALGLSLYAVLSDLKDPCVSEMTEYLISLQLEDGSWTITPLRGHGVSLVYTTCYSLEALVRSGYEANKSYINKGLGWLLSIVNSDGGWGLHNEGESHVHSTSEVLYLLSLLNLPISISFFRDAQDWLLSKRVKNQYWTENDGSPSIFLTALAYRGLSISGNFHHKLEKTRNWLISQMPKAPHQEDSVYIIKINDNNFIQEPVSRYTRFSIFHSLLSDPYLNYEPILEREARRIMNLQDRLGYWKSQSSGRVVPIFLNYYACVGLKAYEAYLERRPSFIFMNHIKQIAKHNPLLLSLISILCLAGIVYISQQFNEVFTFLTWLAKKINQDFENLSGIANFLEIFFGIIAFGSFLVSLLLHFKKKNDG